MEEEKMMPVDAARSEGDAACAPVCRCDGETPEEGDARPESALEEEVERLRKSRHEWVLLYGKAIKNRDEWMAMYEEMAACCDEWRAKAERVESLNAKLGEITDEVGELMKKQPYTFDPNDVPDSLRTVGRYIDELKAFSERLETAAHDKLGVTLFGVDYVTEEFMLHVRDTLTAERDELKADNDRLAKLLTKSMDAYSTLEAERDELKKQLDTMRDVARDFRDERDEWKAKADGFTEALEKLGCSVLANGTVFEGSSKVRVGQSNLEWLFEHDYETLCDQMGGQPCSCCVVGCKEDLGSDEACAKALHDWLMAPHMDARQDNDETCPNDDGTASNHSKNAQTLSDLYGILGGENTQETPDFAENQRKTPENGREDAAFPAGEDSREKLEADVHQYANPGSYEGTIGARWEKKMLGFLNRQAAITSEEAAEKIAELSGEVKRQWKVITTQAESFRKLEAEGCSCPEVIEHLEDGITVGVSVDGVEYVRETGKMRDLKEENRKLHRELARLNGQVRGTRQLPKKCKWPRKDGKLVKIAPTQAREVAFDRTGGWIRWSDSEKDTTRFKYGEDL